MENKTKAFSSSNTSPCSKNSSGKHTKIDEETYKFIELISFIFTDACDDVEKEKEPGKKDVYKSSINNRAIISEIKPFIANVVPSIPINDYLERLVKFGHFENSTIVLMMIYIDRVCDINNIKLDYHNIHKFILASMVVSVKYNQDKYYGIAYYAKVGGIPEGELRVLEYAFLILIKFQLYVDQETYEKYYNYLSQPEEEEEEDS